MAGEWQERTLGDLTENFDSVRVPVKEADRLSGSYPYYGASGIVDHVDGFLFDGEYLLIAEDGENLRTRATPVAFMARGKFWVNNHAHIVRGNDKADTRFLMYSLAAADISGFLSGSTMPKLTQGNMNRIPLLTPPLPEQRAIAHILGTLDDKIELNRRMNETLEAMARTLFKSWFVDFDPVRAKMGGRWRRGSPLHSPLPAGEGSGVRAAPPDRAAVTASLPADLRDFARELRRRTTDAEALLWRLLRNRLMAGAKFRRQHPLPPYVLDFYCHDAGLAVELDGGQHNEAAGRRHDARRDAFLAQKGIRVLRFWNHEVLNQTEAVLEAIYAAMDQASSRVEPSPSPPPPLPGGEGGFHLPAHIYDLFPDRLVDSELGEIPEGWEVKAIDDLAQIVGGSTPSTVQPAYWDDGIHCWATPKDLSALRTPVLLSTERCVTDAGLAQISSGLLPKGTVLLSSRAPIGYLAIAEVPVAINQGFIAMKPRTGVPNLFLLLWARAAHEAILARANGSTFLEISKANFRPLHVVGPPFSVLDAFDHIVRPLYERIVSIERESNALVALRDTLLPKLISGDLRVNVDRVVEVSA